MKKPQHPQARAATRKQLASHGGGGGSGGAAPAKPSHPNAKAAKSVKARAASKKKTAAAAHKPRKWSPDADVALCSARAVAEALRLASGIVLGDEQVLALHWQAGGSEDGGASILGALEASRNLWAEAAFDDIADVLAEVLTDGVHGGRLPDARFDLDHALAAVPAIRDEGCPVVVQGQPHLHTLILGLDLPQGEPHAVTVDADGTWWSWGEPHTPGDFPAAVIEEAWLVCAG